jgi:pimeloyl-ACP methyl ester carboxylesterase
MKLSRTQILVMLFLAVLLDLNRLNGADTPAPTKDLPTPGDVFSVAGHTAFVIPGKADPAGKSKRWVWFAPTLPGLPGREELWMFDQFRDSGIAIAGIDAGESYGSPAGNKLFTEFHTQMIARDYSQKPVLLGRSRGGLMTLSWAASNPDKVSAFAGIYPVCNLASYPGIAQAAGAYEKTPAELQAQLADFNPIDRLSALAKAGVPLFAIHGDIDAVVPLEANSGLMKERYTALGGTMQLLVPKNQGHNMWPGFLQSQELVNFVKIHAGPDLVLRSPLDYQVIQRTSKEKGTIIISGQLTDPAIKADVLEARIITEGKPGEWQKLLPNVEKAKLDARLNVVSGGWYRLEVRALSVGNVLAEAAVEHIGVGEVFVVAGQSNSANYGEEKQTTKTGLVATFDGQHWRPANDPQPGAEGGSGSFMPPLGDAIAARLQVPVGFVACGIGATSVREWLPRGAKFPIPPTIEGRVQRLPSGEWESKGDAFQMFVGRMKPLGPHGFRAVLWHQGESDANQQDSTRTLPGKLYREYLEQLIQDSRREIGWDAPWFVAQASYHVPGDEASPEIRAAQASLWKDGIALEGPDSDMLKGDLRDSGGKGVHFSGKGLREHAARWADKVIPWLEQQK